jgi:putative SOS response-associated peptidase YedK
MPVLIEQSDIDRWLLPSPLSRDTAESLLEPTARGVLTGYEVDPAVNDPAHDDESVVRPFLNTDHE